jgi:excisionase family DNA binding protein
MQRPIMSAQTESFLTITEAAEFLKVSKTSLRRWSNDGRLSCYRVGHRGERRFREKDLLAFVYHSDETVNQSPESAKERLGNPVEADDIKVRPPYHLCTMFKDDDEQWRQIRSYILAHLQPGTQTVYLYQGDQNWLLDRLRAENLDGQALISQGRLHLVSHLHPFLSGEYFSPDRMLNFWVDMIRLYSSATTPKLLLTAEMGWCANGLSSCEHLNQYEEGIDDLLRNRPWVTLICQYSLAEIPAPIIFDNLLHHPYVQMTDELVVGLGKPSPVW